MATWTRMNNTASLPLKVLQFLQHTLPSFSFPVVGVKREKTNRKEQKTQTHHSHSSGINGKAMGLSTSLLSTAARAMYKKCLSPSVLEVKPDVSGE